MTKDINLEDELNPSPDDAPGAPTSTPKEGMPNDESVDPNMPVAYPDAEQDHSPDADQPGPGDDLEDTTPKDSETPDHGEIDAQIIPEAM